MPAEGSKIEKYTKSIAIPDNCMNTVDTDPSKITWKKEDGKNYWIADSFPVNYTGCTFKEAKLYLPDDVDPNTEIIWWKIINDKNVTEKWDLTYIQNIDGGKRKSKKNKHKSRKTKSRKSKKSRKTKSRKSKKSKSHKK